MATSSGDPKAYYGYLFDQAKGPTPVLDALLRAIAQHIIEEIGDKNCKSLVPAKLAPFFREVGGDMDTFLSMPSRSISYVWQVLGCQHALEPTEDSFAPPSIPALTPKGFVRWMSINTLLDPDEYCSYLQYCLANWDLKHPETGEPFPNELPREALPKETDADVNKWHRECADTLRREATPKEEVRSTFPDPRVKEGYSHVRGGFAAAAGGFAAASAVPPLFTSRSRTATSPRPRPPHSRPVTFSHVPGRSPDLRSPGPSPLSPERGGSYRRASSPEDAARRRSFSDYASTAAPHEPHHPHSRSSEHLRAPQPLHSMPPRRHSHPRHYSSGSDSEGPPSPRSGSKKRHPPPGHHASPDPAAFPIRRVNTQPHPVRASAQSPSAPPAPGGTVPTINTEGGDDRRPRRREERPDEPRRTGFYIPFISSLLPGSGAQDRTRSSSRPHNGGPSARHARDTAAGSKLNRAWSQNDDYDSDPTDSDDSRERHRRRRKAHDRDRDRDRERDRDRDRDRDHGRDRDRLRDIDRDRDRDRDWEAERDRRSRRDRDRDRDRDLDRHGDRGKYTYRPDVYRRTSSHADIDRWRDVDVDLHFRDRERERERNSLRDERRRTEPRMPSPAVQVTGVSGRKYPTPADSAWSP